MTNPLIWFSFFSPHCPSVEQFLYFRYSTVDHIVQVILCNNKPGPGWWLPFSNTVSSKWHYFLQKLNTCDLNIFEIGIEDWAFESSRHHTIQLFVHGFGYFIKLWCHRDMKKSLSIIYGKTSQVFELFLSNIVSFFPSLILVKSWIVDDVAKKKHTKL